MKRPLIVFGTRPEAIKLAPVIDAFRKRDIDTVVCVTGQHREMLDQVLDLFELKPDHDLRLMRPGQDLFDVTAGALLGLREIIANERPSVLIVEGDTTTVFSAALAAFYLNIPVAHVEAGLRTGNKRAPFPEEIYRILTSDLADFHFAPTEWARHNLLREGRNPQRTWVTGNTVIDALQTIAGKVSGSPQPPGVPKQLAEDLARWCSDGSRVLLVTGHRRENFGEGFENITSALRQLAERNPEVRIIYPVHLNPNVRAPVMAALRGTARIHLIEPLPYDAFVWLMAHSFMILTDSGGIQEEAPALGKPVLVMRETTERPEGIDAGTSKLVGADAGRIVAAAETLLRDPAEYHRMANVTNPFGDGRAAERIVSILAENIHDIQ